MMNIEALEKAVDLAKEYKHVLITTADADGVPHVGSAGTVSLRPDGHVVLKNWFCPGIVANLRENPRVSIVVWNSATDTGYQLLGEVEKEQLSTILSGYQRGSEEIPMSQVERELRIHIYRVVNMNLESQDDISEHLNSKTN